MGVWMEKQDYFFQISAHGDLGKISYNRKQMPEQIWNEILQF